MTYKSAKLLDTAAALDAAGDRREAIAALERLVRREPFHPGATIRLANFDIAGERYAEAARRLERFLRVKPDITDARTTLTTAYLMSHRIADARACAVETVSRHSGSAWARVILARVHIELGEHEAAHAALEAAGRLGPTPVEAAEIQYELARSLESQGRYEESLGHFERAIALAPDLAHAHQAFGAALLRLGRFKRGWVEHEWRRRTGPFKAAMPTIPHEFYWTGREDLRGRSIFITDEQGLGDAIRFFRYVPMVKDLGARITYEASGSLASLFATAMPDIKVITGVTESVKINYACSTMSLPAVFDTRFETMPRDVPYLHAEPERVTRWATMLDFHPGHRIGLVWAGNPKHVNDRRRSIPASQFLEITHIPEVRFYSLQHQVRDSDRAALDANSAIVRVGETVDGFADIAAIIASLDLVITVDTAIAHLAGALGKPVWVLLAFVADWRWFVGRDDSPWYPTARLFRQEVAGEWGPIIERVKAALQGFVGEG